MSEEFMRVVDCKESERKLPDGKSMYYVLVELSDGRKHNQIYSKPYEKGIYEPIHHWKEVYTANGSKFSVCEARLGNLIATEIK